MNDRKFDVAPVLFIPHGGGPMPLLDDPGHEALVRFLTNVAEIIPKPSAILVISAHWEEDQPTVTAGSETKLLYDYYGFPPESYTITYPVPGAAEIAKKIQSLLKIKRFAPESDTERGLDHGVFVPLKMMYPGADIPTLQLSLVKGLNPELHIKLGRALAPLRKKNVLILGSGMSYHNLSEMRSLQPVDENHNLLFHQWLYEACVAENLSKKERSRRLANWESAPYARECHPREEHLIPLQVCYGAAESKTPMAKEVFAGEIRSRRVTGLLWE